MQGSPAIKLGGSPNVEMLSHLDDWGYIEVGGIDIDQDPSRPFLYLHTWKMEVRYPNVFVASYEDGMQLFEMRDPANPKTVGWYYTCKRGHLTGFVSDDQLNGPSVSNCASDLDVRNHDGLIVVSDITSGVWLFVLNGFHGWSGDEHRDPDLSSAQHWGRSPAEVTGAAGVGR